MSEFDCCVAEKQGAYDVGKNVIFFYFWLMPFGLGKLLDKKTQFFFACEVLRRFNDLVFVKHVGNSFSYKKYI